MSRSSPLVASVMDEDFDLCISETNLPFPYSDHCSTGPPSLYDFEDDDEDDEDEDEQEGEDEEDDDEEAEEGEIIVRKENFVDDDDDENDPPLTFARRLSSNDRTRRSQDASDLSNQLLSRLERIHDDELDGRKDTSSRSAATTPSAKTRPRFSQRSPSYESTGEWHEEEEDEEAALGQSMTEEEQELRYYKQYHQQQQQQYRRDKGLIPRVTTAVSSVAYAVGKHWSKKIYESLLRSRDPKAYYTHLLKAATNYEQWAEAAAILDRLQGKDKWKNDPRSSHYDYEMLEERLSQLASARESGDLGLMIFLLRTSLSRNLGNVGRPQLYAETIIGTKRLIEDYNSEVIRQLNIICDTESDDFSVTAKLEFFTHTRQAFGRTALLLSGGATMGLMHIGVIKTLYESQLLPRIISGSSCGSIIAAILCTRTDEEIPSMLQFEKFNFTVFHTVEEQGDVLARLIHFLKNGALFDAQVLKAALKDNIGDVTFQEAYNRTRRILNVTVSTSATFEMPRLLNYLTAPNVLIWSAVATSCAAPFIYNSAPLMAKDKNGEEVQWNPSRYHWIDGSVENDLPMNKLSELFNVNHFIVCQVNPYIVPFLHNSLARSPSNRVLGWMLYQARSELQHRMNQLSLLGVMPELIHKAQAIMSQRYYGDITIVPDLGVEDYLNIVSNPTVEFLVDATLKGERATWPKISIIKNHCSIEHCLDDILYRLRLRRLEAYRAYPQAPASLNKMPSDNSGYVHNGHQPQQQQQPQQHPPGPARHASAGSANPATMRGSVSVCFGAIGRANSSPVSPTHSTTLGMSRSTSPLGHSNLGVAKGATTTLKEHGVESQNLRVPHPSVPDYLRREEDDMRASGSSPVDVTTLPITTTTSEVGTPAFSPGVVRSKPMVGPRRGSSGSICGLSSQHPRPPPIRRSNSSSGPGSLSHGMPLPFTSRSSSTRTEAVTIPTTKPLSTTFSSPRRGHRNSIGSASEYQSHGSSDTATTTTSTTNRRSSNSSVSSLNSLSYASSAPSTSAGSYFVRDVGFLQSPLSDDATTFQGAPTSFEAAVAADTMKSSMSSSAPNTPVPVVVHTNPRSSSGSARSGNNSRVKSNSKRAKNFQMTSLE